MTYSKDKIQNDYPQETELPNNIQAARKYMHKDSVCLCRVFDYAYGNLKDITELKDELLCCRDIPLEEIKKNLYMLDGKSYLGNHIYETRINNIVIKYIEQMQKTIKIYFDIYPS